MNIWQLKKEFRGIPPSKMTRTKIAMIEEYCRNLHRSTWMQKRRRGQFERICESVVKFLDKPLVVSLHASVGFLILQKNAYKVYYSENDWIWQDITTTPQSAYITHKDGKQYLESCFSKYYVIEQNEVKLKYDLKWKIPECEECQRCSLFFVATDLQFTELLDGYVDKVCFNKLKTYKNPPINWMEPITQYHSHKGKWIFIPRRLRNETTPYFGVEIEVQSRLGNTSTKAQESALRIITANDADENMYFEWDGSLDSGGFEIVTNPMTLDFHKQYWAKHLPIIRKYCGGYDAEKLLGRKDYENMSYGIHLTIHRKFLPNTVITKLARFFDLVDNRAFIHCIAQRNEMYGGYPLGNKTKPRASDTFDIKDKGAELITKNRRSPITLKSKNLAEFRICRSTLNTVSFFKNLEFLEAIIFYFIQQTGNDINYLSFLKWVANPINAKRYPNLLAYLQHPMFFVKGIGRIKNEWAKQLKLYLKSTKEKRDPLAEFGPIILVDEFDISERSTV